MWLASPVDSGVHGGQWGARWTVGCTVDSGVHGGQWGARWTVGCTVDSGVHGGQWGARWTVECTVDCVFSLSGRVGSNSGTELGTFPQVVCVRTSSMRKVVWYVLCCVVLCSANSSSERSLLPSRAWGKPPAMPLSPCRRARVESGPGQG